jgi:hypothetical protein
MHIGKSSIYTLLSSNIIVSISQLIPRGINCNLGYHKIQVYEVGNHADVSLIDMSMLAMIKGQEMRHIIDVCVAKLLRW